MSHEDLGDFARLDPAELSPRGKAHLEQLQREVGPQIAFVRSLRTALGYSQTDLAELMGKTQSAVSKIESKGAVPLATWAQAANAKRKRLRLVIEDEEGVEEARFALP